MKLFLAFVVLLPLTFTGCAGTLATGKFMYTQANADYIEWHGGANPSFKAWKINHSTPTRAGGSVIGTSLMGAAGLMAGHGVVGLVKP